MGPEDEARIAPGVERLMGTASDRTQGNGLEPVLTESVDEDVASRRIIFHLRPGVRFQDGSSLDADVVIWNFRQVLDSGPLQFADHIKDIKKLDDMTVALDYTEYSNQLIHAWGIADIFSRDAWMEASGGDLQKGIDWTRTHVVGTGPFILKEFNHGDR
jgi:peptide/nickel transport system substrate-binding protein